MTSVSDRSVVQLFELLLKCFGTFWVDGQIVCQSIELVVNKSLVMCSFEVTSVV